MPHPFSWTNNAGKSPARTPSSLIRVEKGISSRVHFEKCYLNWIEEIPCYFYGEGFLNVGLSPDAGGATSAAGFFCCCAASLFDGVIGGIPASV